MLCSVYYLHGSIRNVLVVARIFKVSSVQMGTPSPLFIPVPDKGTREDWYLYPQQACATTASSECAR